MYTGDLKYNLLKKQNIRKPAIYAKKKRQLGSHFVQNHLNTGLFGAVFEWSFDNPTDV